MQQHVRRAGQRAGQRSGTKATHSEWRHALVESELRGTVLIVDDDDRQRNLLADQLHRQGYDVIAIADVQLLAEEAAALRTGVTRRDIVVCAPSALGKLSAEDLHAVLAGLRNTPVVFLARGDDDELRARCRDLGALIVPSPVPPQRLTHLIDAHVDG
jgi:DNA-binding response OmpR family regulator